MKTCKLASCNRPYHANGYCSAHAARVARKGNPDSINRIAVPNGSIDIEARFFSHVLSVDDCWVWCGTKDGKGYGSFSIRHKYYRAHRVCYELLIGPIVFGLDLDHLCRNPSCVNPGHLEPVSRLENSIRGMHPNFIAHRNGTCRNGHPRTQMYFRKSTGRPVYCRACKLDQYISRHGHAPRAYRRSGVSI